MAHARPKRRRTYSTMPGMSESDRRHRRRVFWRAVLFGVLAAAAIGTVIWLMNADRALWGQ